MSSADASLYPVKATYFPSPEGLKLARIDSFEHAFFPEVKREGTGKKRKRLPVENPVEEVAEDVANAKNEENARRSVRRARMRLYDLLMCNSGLNLWVTLTYSPEKVDKSDYSDCYAVFKVWASNAVQRAGLRYVGVPELTKKGDVHFHLLCNAEAVKLVRAINPNDGRPIRQKGRDVYNVANWNGGFSTAIFTDKGSAPRALALYMLKYMGKDVGFKVGGRYVLTGGKLDKPVEIVGETVAEFLTGSEVYTSDHRVDIERVGVFRRVEFDPFSRHPKKCVDTLGE